MPNVSGSGRARLLGIALLVATFLAGGISGAAVSRRTGALPQSAAVSPEVQGKAAEPMGDQQRERRSRLIDQIGLTSDQRAAIDSILHEGREKIDAYWKETEPGYRALVDSTRAMVRAVMTPEQLAEYDRLRAERRARVKSEADTASSNHSGGRNISKGACSRGNTLSGAGTAATAGGCGFGGIHEDKITPGWRAEPKESRTE